MGTRKKLSMARYRNRKEGEGLEKRGVGKVGEKNLLVFATKGGKSSFLSGGIHKRKNRRGKKYVSKL